MRKSGIEVVGDVPWGSHLSLFYEARADLMEVVTSFLKDGLESNERCVWVMSPNVSRKAALAALAAKVPSLELYLRGHRLEVVPHDQVYFSRHTLSPEHVRQWWRNELEEASQKGLEGLRVAADAAWVERRDWDAFSECEKMVSGSMSGKKMLALSTYPLDKCSPGDIFDMMQAHGVSVVKRHESWRVISAETGQRWATHQMQERDAYIANILRTVSVGIVIVSLDGSHPALLVNDSLCRMTGFSREELEGQRPPFSYWDPDGLDTIQRVFQEALTGASLNRSFELPFRRKDGQKFIAQVDFADFTDDRGRRIAFSVSVQDITERKEVERRLTIGAQLLNAATDGITVHDFNGNLTYFNEASWRSLGYTKDEFATLKIVDLFIPEHVGVVTEALKELKEKGEGTYRSLAHRKDGAIVPVEVHARVVTSGDRQLIMSVVRDITERKQAEEELRRRSEETASLLKMSEAVTSSLDLDQVLEEVINNVRRVIQLTEHAAISMYDDQLGYLVTRKRFVAGQESHDTLPIAIRPGEGITGRAFQTGEARLYATAEEVAEAQANLSNENRQQFLKVTRNKMPTSTIVVPVQSESRILGTMLLHTFGQQAFTSHDFELAQVFAGHAAVAINNATLYKELQRRSADLASLIESSRAVASSLNLGRVMRTIMENIRRVIPAAKVQAIALYDETDGLLKTRFASGTSSENIMLLAMKPGEGITGKTFQSSEARLYATALQVAEAQTDLASTNLADFLKVTGGKRPSSSIGVPLKLGDKVLGCMLMHSFGEQVLTPHDLELAQAFASNAAVAISNATLHEEMQRRALTDGLTGLYNRGHFYERLREETARHSRERRPLCVAMLDVNRLKAYNDTYDHLAGDQALQVIAKAMKAAVRQSDIVFRYGGDEFSIILVNTSGDVAKGAVDRVKAHVAKELASSGVSTEHLGLSAGVAAYSPDGWAETDLVEAADKALYRSKATGGVTVLYGPDSGQKQ